VRTFRCVRGIRAPGRFSLRRAGAEPGKGSRVRTVSEMDACPPTTAARRGNGNELRPDRDRALLVEKILVHGLAFADGVHVGFGSRAAFAKALAPRPVYPRKLTTCCNAQVVGLGSLADIGRRATGRSICVEKHGGRRPSDLYKSARVHGRSIHIAGNPLSYRKWTNCLR
jgi:hypothetical protein